MLVVESMAKAALSVVLPAPPSKAFSPLQQILLPFHQASLLRGFQNTQSSSVRAAQLPLRAVQTMCCICLSLYTECHILAASEREYFNITQKVSSSHNCHCFFLSTVWVILKKTNNNKKNNKRRRHWFFRGNEKETPFHFCLGVLLNTRLFTQSCLQKYICLI